MQTIKLRPVQVSPSTIQYQVPINKGYPKYKRRFFPNEEAQKTLSQPWLRRTDPMMPPYPFKKHVFFEEANHGLYGGATIQSGNKISKGRNKGKTLRKWYPNVRVEKLKSEALNVEMAIPTTARVMRTIRKCGGLDQYVLGPKPARIKELGLLGWKLRWMVMNSKGMKKKHAEQRQALGLLETTAVDATFEEAWADQGIRNTIIEKMYVGWEALGKKDERFTQHVRKVLRWNQTVPELRALKLYSPDKLPLPEAVEVEGSKLQMPNVPAGWSISEVMEGRRGTPKVEAERELEQESKKLLVEAVESTNDQGESSIAGDQATDNSAEGQDLDSSIEDQGGESTVAPGAPRITKVER